MKVGGEEEDHQRNHQANFDQRPTMKNQNQERQCQGGEAEGGGEEESKEVGVSLGSIQDQIHTLMSQIPQIHSYKGKWSSILSTLQNISSQIPSLPLSNPLSPPLLHSLSHALSRALSLSSSSSSSFSSSKLLALSSLSSLSSNLVLLSQDTSLLLHHQPQPTNSTSPSPQLHHLLTLLQLHSSPSKLPALHSLVHLLHTHPKAPLLAISFGAIPVLSRLLNSPSPDVQHLSVSAISPLSALPSAAPAFHAEGPLLLHHLLRSPLSATPHACIALHNLTPSTDIARSVASHGGVSTLLHVCRSGTPAAQPHAAGALRNLAAVPEIRPNFLEDDGVPILVELSASSMLAARENSIGCLSNLVSDESNVELKMMVLREFSLDCLALKSYWDAVLRSGMPDQSLEAVIGLLRNLGCCEQIADVLVSAGFVVRLTGALNSVASSVRVAAARAVFDLSISPKSKKEMGECGCISSLVRMLDAKVVEEREAAVKALSSLLLFPCHRRFLQREDRGIESVVLLLDPRLVNLEKKYPVSVLLSISPSKRCRKRMIAAGACAYVQKLVELDIEGAKKLLQSIGRDRLWGVFTRA